MSLLANSNAIESGGYNIDRSLRFRSSASAYLSRTPASSGNRRMFTLSMWLKRGKLGTETRVVGHEQDAVTDEYFGFNTSDQIYFFGYQSGNYALNTTAVFRDPSAWYHIVVSIDTANATASNRTQIYVNGVLQTLSGSYVPQNYDFRMLAYTVATAIGTQIRNGSPAAYYFDGYLAEVNFIDGQALTPSSFGQTDAVTGVWVPKKYTGTYGTNGFYLPFSDNTSATTLAYDKSGNGNNWTPNNISTTAGATYDSMTDVPTLTSATAANYCVLNQVDKSTQIGSPTGLYVTASGGSYDGIRGTFQIPTSGKWYWEVITTGNKPEFFTIGICQSTTQLQSVSTTCTGNRHLGLGSWYTAYNGNTPRLLVDTYASNPTGATNWSGASNITDGVTNTYMIAVDMDNGTMWWGKGGTWFNTSGTANPATNTDPRVTGLTGTAWFPYATLSSTAFSGTVSMNFGQQGFSYTPPTGFKALNTFNLPDPTIKKPNQYMDATTYTGNGVDDRNITGTNFAPDFVWIKQRSGVNQHELYDTVRGATKRLMSNDTAAEDTAANNLQAFLSDGFQVGTAGSVNANGATYVGWQWKKGATQGFDIVTYTGTGANRTVAHSLGVAPKMMIVKNRSASATSWIVYHASLGATTAVYLDTTGASSPSSLYWNNTDPTSSVFTVGAYNPTNGNTHNLVAYLFSEIPQFSKAFSFTGNASTDGSFVHLGFKPKVILLKCSSTTGNWYLFDTVRNTYNVIGEQLYPNLSNAGSTVTTLDALSNGFKMRLTGDPNAAQTYIGFAWADSPFKYSTAV